MDFARSVDTGAARRGVESYVFYEIFLVFLSDHLLCAEISAALREALRVEGT